MEFLKRLFGSGIKETIEAVGNAIDKIDNSEEKISMQLKYKELLLTVQTKLIEQELEITRLNSDNVKAEIQGESWLQRNWRPILMLICIFIVFNNYVLVPYFKAPSATLDNHIWTLIELGVGGYIAGRSLEKIAGSIDLKEVLKKK